MSEINVAVKGILIKNNQMLIVKRAAHDETGAGTWECVGGVMKFGESFEEALQREFLEEVGLQVQVRKLLFSTTFLTSATRQIVLLSFLCECENMNVTLSGEHEEFRWAAKHQLLTLLPEPKLNDFIIYGVLDLL